MVSAVTPMSVAPPLPPAGTGAGAATPGTEGPGRPGTGVGPTPPVPPPPNDGVRTPPREPTVVGVVPRDRDAGPVGVGGTAPGTLPVGPPAPPPKLPAPPGTMRFVCGRPFWPLPPTTMSFGCVPAQAAPSSTAPAVSATRTPPMLGIKLPPPWPFGLN